MFVGCHVSIQLDSQDFDGLFKGQGAIKFIIHEGRILSLSAGGRRPIQVFHGVEIQWMRVVASFMGSLKTKACLCGHSRLWRTTTINAFWYQVRFHKNIAGFWHTKIEVLESNNFFHVRQILRRVPSKEPEFRGDDGRGKIVGIYEVKEGRNWRTLGSPKILQVVGNVVEHYVPGAGR